MKVFDPRAQKLRQSQQIKLSVSPDLSGAKPPQPTCCLNHDTNMMVLLKQRTWQHSQPRTLLLFRYTHTRARSAAACRAFESAVGGDSLALHSCVSC